MGRPDVDELLGELDSRQLSEWMAYDLANVTDLERSTALLCSVVANAMGGGRRTWSESDFLVKRIPDPEMSDAQIMATIRGLAAAPGEPGEV